MWCYCMSVSHWHRKAREGRVDWQGFLLKCLGYGQPALAKRDHGHNCWPEDCCLLNCCLHPCSLAPTNYLPLHTGWLVDLLCFAKPVFCPPSYCFQLPKGCVLCLVSVFSSLSRWVEVVSCLDVLHLSGLKYRQPIHHLKSSWWFLCEWLLVLLQFSWSRSVLVLIPKDLKLKFFCTLKGLILVFIYVLPVLCVPAGTTLKVVHFPSNISPKLLFFFSQFT